MSVKFLEPGQKIEMRHKVRSSPKDGQPAKVHISQIYDILEDDTIEVLMPIEHSQLTLLPLNAVYTLVVYTHTGVYQCDTKVTGRYKKARVYLISLELVSQIKKYQRREYYRYSCNLPIFSRLLTEKEMETRIWDVGNEGAEGDMLDLGGGGVRFITAQQYEKGDLILCRFTLSFPTGEQEYQILGTVLSIVTAGKYENKFEVRVQFEEITNLTREEIIQFIFEDERRQKKGRRR
ncbi:MAG: flagellar brake protein [Lachnospiraceae bacterium]|nr:flagellar brake protein [Lachnospiraceae bacterium]